jgi:hypothetical protein
MSTVSGYRVATWHVIRDLQETGNSQMGQAYVTQLCLRNTVAFCKTTQYSKSYIKYTLRTKYSSKIPWPIQVKARLAGSFSTAAVEPIVL